MVWSPMMRLKDILNFTQMDNYSKRAIFYDNEYYTHEDFSFLERILNGGGKKILEIPCGAGRTFDLHKQYENEVVFADKNGHMVDIVNRKINNLSHKRKFTCIVADITDINLSKQFDVILVLKEAFQLIPPSEVTHVLKCLKGHLSPKGRLYIDIFDFNKSLFSKGLMLPEYLDESKSFKKIKTIDEKIVERKTSTNYENDILTISYKYWIYQDISLFDKFESVVALHNWSHNQLERFIEKVGLNIQNKFSNYQMEPYLNNSPRIIYELKL